MYGKSELLEVSSCRRITDQTQFSLIIISKMDREEYENE